jgi:hypothetical protein
LRRRIKSDHPTSRFQSHFIALKGATHFRNCGPQCANRPRSNLPSAFTTKHAAESAAKGAAGVQAVANDLEVYLPAINERPNPNIMRDAIMTTELVAMHGRRLAADHPI